MRSEQISDAMGMLPDEVIEETDEIRDGRRKLGKKYPMPLLRLLPAAACLVLFVGVVIKLNHNRADDAAATDLPILSVSFAEESSYGFEGLMAYDISELVNANPRSENLKLDTLPVYKNKLELEDFVPVGFDKEYVRNQLIDVAARLGIDESELGNIEEEAEMCTMTLETDKYIIRADASGDVRITFANPETLPESVVFNFESSYEDCEKAADYFKEQYKDVLKMDLPVANIHDGDYDIYGYRSYDLSFYDGKGDIVEQLINYNFRQVKFAPDSENGLSFIDICCPDLSEKVGDYPIISADEAKALLKSGEYYTSVPYDMPGVEYVAKVEPVYRTGILETYFMPFYKFYVELPEEAEHNDLGLKTYGAYYVPAVEGRYLKQNVSK
ncbi:MAG: hypothetical protein K6A74_01960 [Lachnospiraceae bacterium]|nr:hypothetical protein [Lachnospiraceae bacterium]